MEYVNFSLEVVFPMILYMIVGYFIKKTGMATQEDFNAMNRMIFYIFLPLKLFLDITGAGRPETFPAALVGFVLFGLLRCFLIFCAVVPIFVKTRKDVPVVIQGIFRSNYVLYGLAIATNIYPDKSMGLISMLVAFIAPLFNTLTVIIFEFYINTKVSVKNIIRVVLKNRFVQMGILSGIFLLFNLRLPDILAEPLSDMGFVATPLALICLGASFTFEGLGKYAKILLSCCSVRLAIVPAIFIVAAILLGYRNTELVAIMVIFGSPSAISSYTMGKELGGNGELAGMIVVATSVLSMVSMVFWISVLKSYHFI